MRLLIPTVMKIKKSKSEIQLESDEPEMLEQFQASEIFDQVAFKDHGSILKTPNRASEPSISHHRASENPLDPSVYLASPDGSLIMIRKANNGRMSPVMGKSVKDYEEKMKVLRQENFDLRLYCYHLEQKLKDESRNQSELTIKRYTVQLETEQAKLQQQLEDKNDLLKTASSAIESLKSENDAVRRDLELAGSDSQHLTDLRRQIEDLLQDRDALRRELEDARYKLAEMRFSREQHVSVAEDSDHIANLEESGLLLRDRLANAESRVTELTQQLSQFEANTLTESTNPEGGVSDRKVKELEHELDSLNQKYERSVKAIQSFIRKVSKRDKEIGRLQEKLSEMSARLEEQQREESPPQDSQEKAEEAERLRQRVQTLEASLCEEKAESSQKLSSASAENARLSEEMKTLNLSLDSGRRAQEERCGFLQREVARLQAEKKDLTEALTRAREETSELKRRVSEAESADTAAPEPSAGLLSESKRLRASLRSHEEDTARLRSRVQQLQTLLDERTGALTMAHSDAAARAEAVQEKYTRLVEGLESRLEHKEQQLQLLVQSLASRDQLLTESLGVEAASTEKLCRQLEEKEAQISGLLDAKSSLTAELAAARREVARRTEMEKAEARRSLQEAQVQAQRLQQELADAEDTVLRLQSDVEKVRDARSVTEDQGRRQVEERDALIRKLQASLSEQAGQLATLTESKVGPSPALASFEAMVQEKAARLEDSLALREKALSEALHEYRCLASVVADKQAELDRVREEGAATAAELRALVHGLEKQVEDAEFELSHMRELLHRSEESHVDRLERASTLLEARDRTIDSLLAESKLPAGTTSLNEASAAAASPGGIALHDLCVSQDSTAEAPPKAKDSTTDSMELSALHSEVARLRGLLTEKEELLERLGAPHKGVARRLFTLRRQPLSSEGGAGRESEADGSPSRASLSTPQLQTLHSQILGLLQTLERTQHLQESFFGDLMTTANESLLLQQQQHLKHQQKDTQQDPAEQSASSPPEGDSSPCPATPSRLGDQSLASLSGLSFFLNRLPRTPGGLQGGNVTLTTEGVTMTEEMHEMVFERLREQVDQLRSALAACSEQGLSLMQEAALVASTGPQRFAIDSEDWAALLRRLLARLEKDEAGQESETLHRDVRIAVGLCRQIVDRLDRQLPDSPQDKVSPEATGNRSLTASQLRSTYEPRLSTGFSVTSLSPFNLDDSELEPEDLSKTLNVARSRCTALEGQLKITRDRASALEAENKVLRLRLSRDRADKENGSPFATPDRTSKSSPGDSGLRECRPGQASRLSQGDLTFTRSPFRSPARQRGEPDSLLLQDIVDLERERSALESELSRVRDLCASGDTLQRSLLDSRIEQVTEQLRTMRLDLSIRLQDQSRLNESDLGSHRSTSLGGHSRRSGSTLSGRHANNLSECEELRHLVVDLRRQLAEKRDVSDVNHRLSMVTRDLELERERVAELILERDRLVLDRAEGTQTKENLQRELETAHDTACRLRRELADISEQLRMRESTDTDRLAIEERIVSIRAQMAELEAENAAVRARAELAEAQAEQKRAEVARLGRACAGLTEEAECLKARLSELAESEAEKAERLSAKAAEEQRLTIALVNAEDDADGLRRQRDELESRTLALESSLKAEKEQRLMLSREKAGMDAELVELRDGRRRLNGEVEELSDLRAKLESDLEAVCEDRSRLAARLASLEGESAELVTERHQLTAELSRFREERARLGSELSAACEDRTMVCSELALVSEERARLAGEQERLSVELERVAEEAARLRSDLAEASQQGARLSAELADASEEKARVGAELAETAAERSRLSSELALMTDERAQLATELSQMTEERLRLSSELMQASDELARAGEERLELLSRLEAKSSGLLTLEEEVRRVTGEVAALQEEKGAADSRASESERHLKAAREDLEELRLRLDSLQEENRQLVTELGLVESRAEALVLEKERCDCELQTQRDENREMQSENSSLTFKVKELQDTLSGWREAIDMLERRLEDRSASVDRLSSQFSELAQLRESAELRSAALEGELASLRSSRGDWDVREEESRSLHVLRAELERRLERLTEQLQQRDDTIEALKKESADYFEQVQRFSPEIRSLQSNLASVTSHRSELRACLDRLHSRVRHSVKEHQAVLTARGIAVPCPPGRDSGTEPSQHESGALDLTAMETELHRAFDEIHSLKEELEQQMAKITAKDAALADMASDLEAARAETVELERAKDEQEKSLTERLEQSKVILKEAEQMPSAAQLRETGEMIRALEGRVRELLSDKEKWKAAAKELRAKLDTRTSRLEACIKQNVRLKALIKKDEQQAEDRRFDLQQLTMNVEGKNDTISRLQRQLKTMQRELEMSRSRGAGHNNSNIHASNDPSDASEAAQPAHNTTGSCCSSRSSTSSTVTSVQSSRESVRAPSTPIGAVAPLTPALSDVTGNSLTALSSGRRAESNVMELLSLQAKLRATENLNKSLRAELSLAEQQIVAIKSPRTQPSGHASCNEALSANASQVSGLESPSFDGLSPPSSARVDQFLRTYIEEIRALRSCLEASIAENDQLREALQQQLLDEKSVVCKKAPSQLEKENRRLRERLTNKKRRLVELEAELAGVRARTDSSERENLVLRSELQATKELLSSCKSELELLGAKRSGGRREMLRETQRLRLQLERSLESNRRLHVQLQQQLAEMRPQEAPGQLSNISTPKVSGRPGALDDIMSEVSAVVASPHSDRLLRRCGSESLLGSKAMSKSRSARRRLSSARSKCGPDPVRVDSDFRLLYAISRLDDYELLRKEVQETLCLVQSVRSRIDDRVRHYKSESMQVRSQSLDYSTLKELQSEVSSLVYFLEEENRLVGRFWTAELPPRDQHGHYYDPSSHVQLMESQLEVERLRGSNRLLRQLLDQNELRLVETDRAKSDMESALVERLSTTEHVLSAARGTLERSTASRINKTT